MATQAKKATGGDKLVGAGVGGAVGGIIGAAGGGPIGAGIGAAVGGWLGHVITTELSKGQPKK